MVLSIVLGESLEHALGAVGILTAVAVVLVLSIGVLLTVTVILPFHVDVNSFMLREDLCKVILALALMHVYITVVTEVLVVVLTVLSCLIAALRAATDVLKARLFINLDFSLHRIGEQGALLVVDQVLVLEHVMGTFSFEIDGVVVWIELDL